MATTGRSPAMAMPAAAVTACCSAMPTSRKRSGNSAWKGSSPVGPGMAAVMATTSGRLPGGVEHGAGEGVGVGRRRDRRRRGDRGGLDLEVVQALDVVLLGRGVAPALLGEDVDDDGAAPFRGVGEGLLHAGDVVAVDGPGVADPEGLEEAVRRHDLAHRAREAVQARVGEPTEPGDGPQDVAGPLAGVDVGRAQAQVGEARRTAATPSARRTARCR